ncbi:hypothetical protein JV33_20695 [Pectobacterium carotovorum subsp. carotovorum]|nr:hypothetical protein JV33_20695 [Pectobacterium carotovorum subsp. carotovorum]KML64964.1 hypothetical protein G032_21125 [Pectobacterium carotovorum subsp. carotovorum ICMP 5702]
MLNILFRGLKMIKGKIMISLTESTKEPPREHMKVGMFYENIPENHKLYHPHQINMKRQRKP